MPQRRYHPNAPPTRRDYVLAHPDRSPVMDGLNHRGHPRRSVWTKET